MIERCGESGSGISVLVARHDDYDDDDDDIYIYIYIYIYTPINTMSSIFFFFKFPN